MTQKVTLSPVVTPSLVRPHHKRSGRPQPHEKTIAQISLCEKITQIFCCCCFKMQPETRAEQQPQIQNERVSTLIFEKVGTGDREHYVLQGSSSNDSLPEQQDVQEESMIEGLNRLDYQEVRGIIEKHRQELSIVERDDLLDILMQMERSAPYLDPKKLQRINMSQDLFEEICSHASLAVIYQKGKQLLCNWSQEDNAIDIIGKSLQACYIFSGQTIFHENTGRYPKDFQERIALVRWGALDHYREERMPEAIQMAVRENEGKEHKDSSVVEVVSTSIEIEKDQGVLMPSSPTVSSLYDSSPLSQGEKNPKTYSFETTIIRDSDTLQFEENALSLQPFKEEIPYEYT